MVDLTTEQFEAARARGEARMLGPRAGSAHYDAGRNRVIVRLTTGVEIGFSPRDVEGLQHARLEDLRTIEVEAFGLGIRFPTLDADLYVPTLLEGVLGSKAWMMRLEAPGGRKSRIAAGAAPRGGRSTRARKATAGKR